MLGRAGRVAGVAGRAGGAALGWQRAHRVRPSAPLSDHIWSGGGRSGDLAWPASADRPVTAAGTGPGPGPDRDRTRTAAGD